MDFDDAIRAHVEWKLKLRMTIAGQGEKLNSEIVGRDSLCELGKWLYGAGAGYSGDPVFTELQEAHARFHRAAAEVLAAAERGDRQGAEQRLEGGDYSTLSSAVVAAIIRLREKHAQRGRSTSI